MIDLHAEGFFGTNANWAADMTLLLMLIAGVLFNVGFYLARQDKITAHKWVQTSGAVINLILVLWLMVLPFRDFIIKNDGGPRDTIFYVVTIVHALIGLPGILFGWFVILRGHGLMIKPLRFNNYKPFMRVAYGLYMTAIAAGILVYIVWFVVLPLAQVPTYE